MFLCVRDLLRTTQLNCGRPGLEPESADVSPWVYTQAHFSASALLVRPLCCDSHIESPEEQREKRNKKLRQWAGLKNVTGASLGELRHRGMWREGKTLKI